MNFKAGGQIGSHILAALLKSGKQSVTVIQRPDSTNTLPEGTNITSIDYYNEKTALVNALKGHQFLVVTMSVSAPQDMITKLIHAAAEAQVDYILPNWYGQDPEDVSLREDTMLLASFFENIQKESKAAGIPYVLLGCNFWYEFSLGGGPNRYGFDFKKKTLTLFDKGEKRLQTTTWPQCGRAIAQLLSLPMLPQDERDQSANLSQFANKAVYVSSFNVSQKEMFESAKRVTNTTDADWTITHETSDVRFKESLELVQKHDFSAFTKLLYSRVWLGVERDVEMKGPLHNEILGLPVEDLDEATAVAVKMDYNGDVPH